MSVTRLQVDSDCGIMMALADGSHGVKVCSSPDCCMLDFDHRPDRYMAPGPYGQQPGQNCISVCQYTELVANIFIHEFLGRS